MTNYEKIKNMSVGEMTSFICLIYEQCYKQFFKDCTLSDKNCIELCKWLITDTNEEAEQ